MKKCLFCCDLYNASQKSCPNCGSTPTIIDGFESYAPNYAHQADGYRASAFPRLARLEAANFWFRSRNKIILWILERYAKDFKSLLEIGCGTGYVLSGIARKFPGAELKGSEIYTSGLNFAAERLPNIHLMQMDAREIPFVDEFEVIGAFDVLEHIKDDNLVLEESYRALKPGGLMILTVPQHPWLWSATDEYAYHERRYTNSELSEKLRRAGFEVVRSTSFVTLLLPAMMLSRFFKNLTRKNTNPVAELNVSPSLNFIFEKVLDLEFIGIRFGMNYPLGGSRLVVAKRPS